jgi:mannose-6-phosphate isomerase-like protein (cupin superfamily)
MGVVRNEREQGGVGMTQITHMFAGADLPAASRLFAVVGLEPGASIGVHQHVGEDEVYYAVRGEGTLVEDGARVPFRAGDAHLVRDGGFHGIENTGSERLEFVAVIVRA